jgi:acyl-homoserine lactone acylase PvdQ
VKRFVVPLLVLAFAPAAQAAPLDFGKQTFNIMPPGQSGALPPDENSLDQLRLYDALTPLFDDVQPRHVEGLFKSARFFAPKGGTVERPRRGITIRRDTRFGVPHIRGRTRSDVYFAIGWVTAQDRGLFMEALRYPARFSILDAPGRDALDIATELRTFEPSAQTERFIARQRRHLARKGRKGRRVVKDIRAYVNGINAYNRTAGNDSIEPWTYVDVTAVSGIIGQTFGAGGGDEVRSSLLLAELRRRLGPSGTGVWRDLRSANDPEASVTTTRHFPYVTQRSGRTPGSLVADAGSLSASAASAARVAQQGRVRASNAVLVGRRRSASGHPLAVMGPQLGFYYPELFLEVDAHGGGIHVRGGTLPGVPYVLIGRTRDYAWSFTSATNDNTDQFLEQLCNPDGSPATRESTHYRYKGRCRPMRTFNAGVLRGGGGPDEPIVFRETVHGPVSGTVTVGGRPYAVATLRSTRGRETLAGLLGSALNEGAIRSVRDVPRVGSLLEYTFNLFYVDHRDIAFFSCGRLPVRAPGTDPSLPTLGTGRYDWRGFLRPRQHPQVINPKSGLILSWNNKPAAGFGSADSDWSFQSVHRNDLLSGFKRRNRLHDVLGVVNRAATQDLRAVEVWPVVNDVLQGGPAPDAQSAQAVALVNAWIGRGASRLDRDLDGTVDDPGAAVLDQSWDALSEAVLRPVLGDLAAPGGLLGQLERRDAAPRLVNGSAYGGGWYGYVEKDLRALLGRPVRGEYSRRYCGNGDLAACRQSLWTVIQQAAATLTAAQGADPNAWRTDATEERIDFVPGVLGDTMRWANRPTLHQLMEFDGHRPVRAKKRKRRG